MNFDTFKQICLPLIILFVFAIPAWAIIFEDGDFLDDDWVATTILDTTPGQNLSFSISRQISGGIPGSFRETEHSWFGPGNIVVSNSNINSVYKPAMQGSIKEIDFILDVKFVGGSLGTSLFAFNLNLEQNGSFYNINDDALAVGPGNGAPGDWASFTFKGLTQDDFHLLSGLGPETPNFSDLGSPITFGYQTSNGSNHGSPIVTRGGIDNWNVMIVPDSMPITDHVCITATASGSTTVGETIDGTSVMNGDFLIRKNPDGMASDNDIVGDGANENTTWIFDFTGPEFDGLNSMGLLDESFLNSATLELDITLNGDHTISTDLVRFVRTDVAEDDDPTPAILLTDALGVFPPSDELATVSIDLLSFYSKEFVIDYLLSNTGSVSGAFGEIAMRYQDDALVSHAQLKLGFIPEPSSLMALSGIASLLVLRRRAA